MAGVTRRPPRLTFFFVFLYPGWMKKRHHRSDDLSVQRPRSVADLYVAVCCLVVCVFFVACSPLSALCDTFLTCQLALQPCAVCTVPHITSSSDRHGSLARLKTKTTPPPPVPAYVVILPSCTDQHRQQGFDPNALVQGMGFRSRHQPLLRGTLFVLRGHQRRSVLLQRLVAVRKFSVDSGRSVVSVSFSVI